MKKVIVNNNVYEGSENLVSHLLKVANETMSENNKYYIYGLEKDNVIELRRDTYKSKNLLNEQIDKFKKNGFKVYSKGGF